jgi:hypothetical protein
MALHSLTTNAWSTDMTNNKHLTTRETAQRLQREPITLQKWRTWGWGHTISTKAGMFLCFGGFESL